MELIKKYNQKWKEHINHHRLRYLITCKKDLNQFLHHLIIKDGIYQVEKHYANMGNSVFPYELVNYQVILKYNDIEYKIYKIKGMSACTNAYEKWGFPSIVDGFNLNTKEIETVNLLLVNFPLEKMIMELKYS